MGENFNVRNRLENKNKLRLATQIIFKVKTPFFKTFACKFGFVADLQLAYNHVFMFIVNFFWYLVNKKNGIYIGKTMHLRFTLASNKY